jgi:hypothetical protein
MFFQKFLQFLVILVTMTASLPLFAQEVAFSELPDAPLPNFRPMLVSANNRHVQPQKENRTSKVEVWTYHSSQLLLLTGLYSDMRSTVDFMQHPQHVHYRDICYGYSPTTGKSIYEGDCGVVFNNYFPKQFVEGGWAVKILRINNRNIGGVVAANVVNGVAVLTVAEYLHRKHSKKLKMLATSLNLFQGSVSLHAGYKNNVYIRRIEKKVLPKSAFDVVWYNPK